MAARGLAEGLMNQNPRAQVELYDPLARLHSLFPKLENLGLALTVRFARGNYDRRWRNGDSPLVGWVSGWPWLQKGLPHDNPGGVVATHVFALRMALAHRQRLNGQWPIYGVVTDYGLHGYWPIQGVDGYFTGHEEVRQALLQRGVSPDVAYASGIPLREDFVHEETWQPARIAGPLRVAMLAGGLQSGAYTSTTTWFVAMLRAQKVKPEQVRFSVVTGSRAALKQQMEEVARHSCWDINVRGIVHDMAGFMRSHDMLIAKPGGLSVAESLACGLPLACLRPGPGQETANAGFLARHGLDLSAGTPEGAAKLIARAVAEPDWLADARRRAAALGKPAAARCAAVKILGDLT